MEITYDLLESIKQLPVKIDFIKHKISFIDVFNNHVTQNLNEPLHVFNKNKGTIEKVYFAYELELCGKGSSETYYFINETRLRYVMRIYNHCKEKNVSINTNVNNLVVKDSILKMKYINEDDLYNKHIVYFHNISKIRECYLYELNLITGEKFNADYRLKNLLICNTSKQSETRTFEFLFTNKLKLNEIGYVDKYSLFTLQKHPDCCGQTISYRHSDNLVDVSELKNLNKKEKEDIQDQFMSYLFVKRGRAPLINHLIECQLESAEFLYEYILNLKLNRIYDYINPNTSSTIYVNMIYFNNTDLYNEVSNRKCLKYSNAYNIFLYFFVKKLEKKGKIKYVPFYTEKLKKKLIKEHKKRQEKEDKGISLLSF